MIELISQTAVYLGDLCERVTLLGGAVVPLLVTDKASRIPRVTKDIDVTIELTSRIEFYALEEELRHKGFQNSREGPVCRFVREGILLDVMPTDPSILGFSNQWYPAAIRSAERYQFDNGIAINLISPACFLATKLDAFDSSGREYSGDMFASRDFEDIVTLIDGRDTIVQDVLTSPTEVCEYLQGRFRLQAHHPYWLDGLEAHLEPGRIDIVIQRIERFLNPLSD